MKIENVADLIAETLIQAGVRRIFGVVGEQPERPDGGTASSTGNRLDSRST
jgi:hypothetical protein